MATIEIKNQGHYGGTYDFEDEDIGQTSPTGWVNSDIGEGISKIIETTANHIMIIEQHTPTATCKLTHTPTASQLSGIIEFWMRVNNTTAEHAFYCLNGVATVCRITIVSAEVRRAVNKIIDAAINTWYHISLRFRATGGDALPAPDADLAEGNYKCYIDEVEYGDWALETDDAIESILLYRNDAITDTYGYWDSFGFSWDTSYTVGDNLTASDTDITSDTIDFKITTEIGKIQKAVSRIKSQTIEADDIIIVTDSYTSRQNGRGIYKDSCDFKNETIGSFPTQTDGGTWADNDGADCESIIIDKYFKHRYVLQLRDQGAGAAIADLDITNTATGKVEFWMATTDPTYELTITLLDQQPAIHAGLQIDNENINYYHDGGWVDSGEDAEVGAWYRCVIHFCCALHKSIYTVYDSDGVEVFSVSNKDSPAPSSTVNDIKFTTQTTDANYICFIDAIGFDWDTSYTLGDNANLEVILADQTIFEGQITKQTRTEIQKFNLISKSEELNQPVGTQAVPIAITKDYTPNMINELMDEYNHATATEQTEIYIGKDNFLEDIDGEFPMGWVMIDYPTQIEVTHTAVGNHDNLLKITHLANGDDPKCNTYFEAQESGTIELWIYCNDVTRACTMNLIDAAGTVGPSWSLYLDNFNYYDGAQQIIVAVSNNTWYRIRVDFECGTGEYLGLAADKANFYIYNAAGTELGSAEGVDFWNAITSGTGFMLRLNSSNAYITHYDAIGFSWDWRYPECRTYAAGDNKQILVDEIEPSGQAKWADDVSIEGDISASKFIKDCADLELMINYLNPSNEINMNDGTNDSQIDFSSTDKIWAVKGEDRIQRINKVIVKCGIEDGGDRVFGTANNTDSQTTYGVKLLYSFAAEIVHQTEADALAGQLLLEHENAPDQVVLWRECSTEGMMQVGETITISASDIRYADSTGYMAAGEWIIRKIEYNPLDSIAKFWLIDSLLYTPDERELESIESLINIGIS